MLNGDYTHRFNLPFVEFVAVQEHGINGVACSGRLDRCGCHIQEVLGRKIDKKSGGGKQT